MTKSSVAKFLIPIALVICCFSFVTGALALTLGVLISFLFENPYPTQKYVHTLLAVSVAGLGAGMNLNTVIQVGIQGFGYTAVSIISICVLGYILVKILKIDKEVGILISVGTAICGGSAIAAVTPVIKAKHQSVSVALGTVFILNAIALIIFPMIGHAFSMSQPAFGLWSALAIHDTSSVVAATVSYGKIAAQVGTTVKLARALWIIPLTLIIGFLNRSKNNEDKALSTKKPWFILWFLIAAALVTWVPELHTTGQIVERIAKQLLVITLFLIGLNLSKQTLKTVGFKPLVLGVTLWIITSVVSFFLIHKLVA